VKGSFLDELDLALFFIRKSVLNTLTDNGIGKTVLADLAQAPSKNPQKLQFQL
jgi:hypothetical protein